MNNPKILGGVGSLFILIGFSPYIGFIFSILGMVLILIANYQIGKLINNQDIFKNTVNGFVIEFIGSFVGGILVGNSLMTMMQTGDYSAFGLFTFIGLAFIYASIIVGNWYLMNAFYTISKAYYQNLFDIGGKFLFWGAIGILVFGLGLIAIFIGWILITIAYFNLPSKESIDKVV